MTSALFVSHTGEMGGAEMFLIDILKDGPVGWDACFLSEGSAATAIEAHGRKSLVLKAGKKMLSIRRNSSFRTLLSSVFDVVAVALELRKSVASYDVVCANSRKALFVCAVASKLARKPLVWFLHDIVTDPAYSSANTRASMLFARLFAKRVVVNSIETGRAFISAGGQTTKVRVVYNGFELAAPQTAEISDSGPFRAGLGLDERPVIGLFGRLSEWKGQHVLLHALSKLPDVQAIIVGGALFGEEAYEERVRALVSDLGLSDRVRFLGFRSDVRNLMEVADIIVHTSIVAEPFGRVVVEGMLAGRPVIATRGGGVTEIIRDGETGILIEPGNVEQLAESIRDLITDHSKARRIAVAGREHAERSFSLEASRNAAADVIAEASLKS